MGIDTFEYNRSSWVLPSLSWSAVTKARARIEGDDDGVPTHVPSPQGDIELHSLSRQIFRWWMSARGERAMPEADDVSLKELVELLPYIRLLHWDGDGDLIVRIFGSALVAAAGFDMTGMSVFLADEYPERENDMARLKAIHEHPCGLLMHRDYVAPDGRLCACEFVNFPVAGGEDGMKRIIGTIVPCEPIEENQLKFNVTGAPVLSRAAFIDIGFGLPGAAEELSL